MISHDITVHDTFCVFIWGGGSKEMYVTFCWAPPPHQFWNQFRETVSQSKDMFFEKNTPWRGVTYRNPPLMVWGGDNCNLRPFFPPHPIKPSNLHFGTPPTKMDTKGVGILYISSILYYCAGFLDLLLFGPSVMPKKTIWPRSKMPVSKHLMKAKCIWGSGSWSVETKAAHITCPMLPGSARWDMNLVETCWNSVETTWKQQSCEEQTFLQ